MIEVTDWHVEAFKKAVQTWVPEMAIQDGLAAAFALIDSAPDSVRKARIVASDWEFTRIMSGEDQDVPTNVFRSECGCHFYTYRQIMDAAKEESSEVEWS
jgi:hypothetical protein